MFNMTRTFANKYDYDLLIISAKYGILKPDDKIAYYNQRLKNKNDVFKLKSKVISNLSKIVEKENYERIIVIMGEIYRFLIKDLFDDRFIVMESKNGLFDYLSKLRKLNQFD